MINFYQRFFTLILLTFCLSAFGQRIMTEPNMQNFSTKDGVSHYGVTTVLEDHNGLIWLGTYDGMDCYNGYDFKNYRNSLYHKVLASNKIRSLFQDKHNNIWIGTNEGISLFDYSTQKTEELQSEKLKAIAPSIVKEIVRINNQIVCVTEHEGVLFFDEDTYELSHHHPIDVEDKSIQFIYGVVTVSERYLMLSTSEGLIQLDTQTDKHQVLFHNSIHNTFDIAKDSQENLYIVTFNGVAVVYTKKEASETSFQFGKSIFNNQRFISLEVDNENRMWLGLLSKGLAVVNNPIKIPSQQDFDKSEAVKYFDIDRVSHMLPDTKSNAWVASFSEGLYNFDFNDEAFQYADLNNSLNPNTASKGLKYKVLQTTPWDEKHILLNTYLWGIVNFNTEKGKVVSLPKVLNNLPVNSQHASIIVDEKGGKWLRYTLKRGVQYYQSPGGSRKWIKLESKDMPQLSMSKPYQITLDKFGFHWLATNIGLFRLKISKGGVIEKVEAHYNHKDLKGENITEVKCVYVDPQSDFIWVGTSKNGLLRIENKEGLSLQEMNISQFISEEGNKETISNNHISSIVRLGNRQLWIGTEGGGICLVESSDKVPVFKWYSERDGLDNNVVKSIVNDKKDNLWITTNKGLNHFNTKTKAFRLFTIEDGVFSSSFENAGIRLPNNKIVFGTGEGICFFNPEKVHFEMPVPKLMMGELRILNQLVEVQDTVSNRQILTKPLNETKEIELAYNENVFSIELLSLHYSHPQSHFIRYRLLPQEKEWVQRSSDLKVASFNGLPPGNYTFEASTSNTMMEWSEPVRLSIIIHPPIWKTLWAYLMYVLIVTVVLFLIIRFLLKHNTLKHELEIEHIEREKVNELSRMKMQMFMNVSHEFRTPLTLISGPIQVLLKMFQSNKNAFEHLDLIQRQSKKMFQLVNQVQDFQKAEQSLLKLKMESFDFTDMMINIKQDFEQLAKKSEKIFILEGDANKIFITADHYKLEIVLSNLLNNAFKFTEKGDTIAVKYKITEDGLYFEVSDTGMGVEKNDLPHLFDRYYQSEQPNNYTIGSGIGLAFSKRLVEMHYGSISVESEKGEGTVFKVSLPVQVSLEEELNEERLNDILAQESHEEKQKIKPNSLELPDNFVDKELKDFNIFYVEDNHDLRNFVSGTLSEYFNVKSFVNGKKCLDHMENEWPDLIISDILMPELNGLELCKAIKADIRTSHIPVILLTSRSTVDDQVKGLEMGGDFYISKPFDMKHLVATVQMLLKSRAQLRERFQVDFRVEVTKNGIDKNDRIFIQKFYDLIESNLDNEDLDMTLLARELYLNRTAFYQKVKAITNQTPHEILKVYRLKKAAEFLVQEKMTVADVCIRTGFKNRTHFSRIFKEYYNVSPSKYGEAMAESQE